MKNVFKQDTRKKSYTFRVGQIQYHRIPSTICLAILCLSMCDFPILQSGLQN